MRLARPGLTVVCFCFLVLTVLIGSACGATVTVGCAGAPPAAYDFPTMSAALNSLSPLNGNAIVVSGTCHENVQIIGFRYLTISGTPGAKLTAPGNPSQITLLIQDAVEISVSNLTVEGPDAPGGWAMAINSSTGSVTNTTTENAVIGVVLGDSTVHFTSVLIQDNRDAGVSLASSHAMFDNTETVEAISSTIQRSGVGVDAGANSVVQLWGGTTIQNNDIGVQMTASNLESCCQPGIRRVLQNGFGIRLLDGSTALLSGIDVEGSSAAGLQMIGSTAQLLSQHTISNNAAGGFGVIVRSSHLEMRNGHIDNNGAFGLLVRENGSLRVQNETITGNGTGIQVSALSSASILSGSVNGNGTDLACSPESVAVGDKTVIGTMHCPSFAVDPIPGPTK